MPASRTLDTVLDPSATRERLEFLAWFMDDAIRIPGLGWRVGADAPLSIIPGLGSAVGASISLYMLLEALRHGLPHRALLRMGGNVTADLLLGSIPVIGFLFDMHFKANRRNLDILRAHLSEQYS